MINPGHVTMQEARPKAQVVEEGMVVETEIQEETETETEAEAKAVMVDVVETVKR